MCDCSEGWYWRFLRDFGPAEDPLEDLKTARFLFVIGGIAFGLGLLPFTVAFHVSTVRFPQLTRPHSRAGRAA